MNNADWLNSAQQQLERAGIGTARLDCLVLLEDATGKDRAWLLAHPDARLASAQVSQLKSKLRQRSEHAPLAQIRGKTEFYGRDFIINQRVLEPRPESETMIDMVKDLVRSEYRDKQPIIVDIGTGSGALATTAKLEIPTAKIIATDIDPACIAVAKKNLAIYKVDVELIQGDLIEPLTFLQLADSTLILLCNLPYVPDNFTINPAAMREPKIAIFGGPDGLDLYRRLFRQIKQLKLNVRFILTESMPPQHPKLKLIAEKYGCKLHKTDDFIQLFAKI